MCLQNIVDVTRINDAFGQQFNNIICTIASRNNNYTERHQGSIDIQQQDIDQQNKT